MTNSLHNQIKLAQQNDEGLKAVCEVLQIQNLFADYGVNRGLLYKGKQKLLAIPKSLEKEMKKMKNEDVDHQGLLYPRFRRESSMFCHYMHTMSIS